MDNDFQLDVMSVFSDTVLIRINLTLAELISKFGMVKMGLSA